MDSKIFISFSHKDLSYRDELVPALEAVAAIRDRVWFDQKGIDIGDQFHPEIQRALTESKIGILLVSNPFLTSEYIKTHELPFLLRQAKRGKLKLSILYVSSVAKAALSVAIEMDGQSRTVNLADILGVNSPNEPLDLIKDRGERNAPELRGGPAYLDSFCRFISDVLRAKLPQAKVAVGSTCYPASDRQKPKADGGCYRADILAKVGSSRIAAKAPLTLNATLGFLLGLLIGTFPSALTPVG